MYESVSFLFVSYHLFFLRDGFLKHIRTSRLPVIYVFGKKHIDIDDCVNRLVETTTQSCRLADPLPHPHPPVNASSSSTSPPTKSVMLRVDVAYAHQAGEIIIISRGKKKGGGTFVLTGYLSQQTLSYVNSKRNSPGWV